jgi:hypothetical protein
MRAKLKSLATAVALIPSLLIISTGEAANERPLSQKELRALYANKSWFWKDGVAFFNPSGRFKAYTGSKSNPNTVTGGWGAYKNGKLCFSGKWKSGQWTSFDSTCFLHKVVNGNIYQRRLPEGDWYIFKHAKSRKTDEYRKMVRGNYVRG